MTQTMKCEIVTLDRSVFSSDKVEFVSLPASEGEMGVLYNHAPTVVNLTVGRIVVREEGAEADTYVAAGGFAEVSGGKVIILADRCQRIADLTPEIVAERIENAQIRLDGLPEGDLRRKYLEGLIKYAEANMANL